MISIDHGTIKGYRDQHCRCRRCSNAKRAYERERMAPHYAARWAEIAAAHAATGERPARCLCPTCKADRKRRRRTTNPAHNQASRGANRAPEKGAHLPYALYPARRATITTTAQSVICCEREAFEDEGAGHDPWCPARPGGAA